MIRCISTKLVFFLHLHSQLLQEFLSFFHLRPQTLRSKVCFLMVHLESPMKTTSAIKAVYSRTTFAKKYSTTAVGKKTALLLDPVGLKNCCNRTRVKETLGRTECGIRMDPHVCFGPIISLPKMGIDWSYLSEPVKQLGTVPEFQLRALKFWCNKEK